MSIFDLMIRRRSVRKYNGALNEVEFLEVKEYVNNIKQLDGCNLKLEIVNSEKVNDKKAPHYILAYANKKTNEIINCGFVLEEADLFLQAKGYGSVFLGMAKPNDKDEEYLIMLGFGKTDVDLRKSYEEFSRLESIEIANIDNVVTDTIRLAPSAMNSQPWFIEYNEDKLVIKYHGRGALKAILRKKLSKIDLGIATKFAELALIKEGKEIKSITPLGDDKNFYVEILFGNKE